MIGAAPRMSLLDALLAGEGPHAGRSAAPMDATPAPRDGLRRDLELLFGTRPRRRPAPAHLAEMRTSVLTYGMSDLRAGPLGDTAGHGALAAEIADRIRRFEPRLAGVTVEDVADERPGRPRFRIRALLRVKGGEGAVTFDAVLDAAGRSLTLADPAEP